MVLVVSTVRIIVGRPMDEPGLLDDGLASSFLVVDVVVVVVVDRLTLVVVSAFLAIPFLSGVEDTDVTLLDVDDVDRVETGSAALRLDTGVVGLLDDMTGRLIPVVLASSTFSDWISLSSCKNSVTESSATGDSATAGFFPFWAEMGVLVRRGMLLLDFIGEVAGDDLALDLFAKVPPVEVLEEL